MGKCITPLENTGFMAEEGGFEPPVEFYPYDGLANRCLKPLGHPSAKGTFDVPANGFRCQ